MNQLLQVMLIHGQAIRWKTDENLHKGEIRL